MNITEFMSFDLAWFTTLPGILITGGVVVLLIALIFFITSNKKEKSKSPEVATVESNTSPAMVDNSFGMGMTNDMPVENSVGINANPAEVSLPSDVNSIDNNAVSSVPSIDTPEVTSFKATPATPNVVDFSAPTESSAVERANTNVDVAPAVEIAPVVSEPTSVTPVVPEVTPVEVPEVPTNTPEVTPVVNESVAAEPVAPVVEEKPVIYGGANPANTVATPEPVKPVIYGGANPLENTTTLPRMVNHEAYGASNTTPVASEPVAVEPVEAVVPEVSQAEPVTPVVPEVTPVEVPVVNNTTPEVAPTVEIPAVSSTMPMTGAEMFGSSDSSVDASSSNEIETLDF